MNHCLECGKNLDATIPTGEVLAPRPESVCLCGYCGSLAIYTEALELRPLTEQERAEMKANTGFWEKITMVTAVIRARQAGRN